MTRLREAWIVAAAIIAAGCGPQAVRENGSGAGADADRVAAGLYCEHAMEMLCSYYMRCGRMAVADLGSCRTTFQEACNTRYEPYYADLEARGALRLSAAGLARCAVHLENVACEAQIRDLDGCDDVWIGTVEAGGSCGASFDRFVCAPGTACVDAGGGCGQCRPTVATDGCNSERPCAGNGVCVEGRCHARAAVAAPCDAGGCVAGARCIDGVCQRDAIVGLGESCGDGRSCQYRATCHDGVCRQTSLLGTPCIPEVGCASGHCVDGVCAAFFAVGAPCNHDRACTPGRCDNGRCAAPRWQCVNR